MNKKNKKTISIIAIAVVIVIVAAIALIHGTHPAKAPVISTAGNSSGTIIASGTPPTVTVSTTTQKFYGNGSFTFSYPSTWSIAQISPFLLTTFNGKYNADETLPAGGAQMAVVTTTVYGSLKDIMTTELMSAENTTTTVLTVDKVSCPAVAFTAAYAAGHTSKNVSIYCQRGTELWKIYLSYGAQDPAAATHLADFNAMWESMKFLP